MNNHKLTKNYNCIKINDKNGQIRKLKIACIFDVFTRYCYEGVGEIMDITPNNWHIMNDNKPDIFMVESAWCGENNTWEKIIANNKKRSKVLEDIIKWCNENNIPTVFWNKEDPLNYDFFIINARLFDYVFTSDENSIEKYRKDLKHERIYTLPFAANPQIHNPIKDCILTNKYFFAGTYYRIKFDERKDDLKKLLDLAIEYGGLDIYDRHYDDNNLLYKFPTVYNPYIKGYLEAENMYKAYKKYKIALNVNCVKDSPTMFSRRVYECLADGIPVISTYSLGINKTFDNLVVSSDDINVLREEFIKLEDEKYYYEKVIKGIREVFNNHTYENRLTFILNQIGISVIRKIPTIGVIIKTDKLEEYKLLKEIYTHQTYKYKKLYLITNNKLLKNLEEDNGIKVSLINKENEKIKIENLIEEDYIGFLGTSNRYGEFYFEDLINATLYTNADIIGKKTYYKEEKNQYKLINEDMDFRYVNNIDLDKCIINKSILKKNKISYILDCIKRNKISNIDCIYFSIDKSNLISR